MVNNILCKLLLACLCTALLAACSSTPSIKSKPFTTKTHIANPIHQTELQTRLLTHFKTWQGTPHKMGGLSKRGIDCSGFVFVTFRDVFDVKLPRSTELLSTSGKKISLKQIKIGDLLIFKTGIRQKHVGIYIGNGKFIHSSSSRGVETSSINSPYWSDKYRQTRRVINNFPNSSYYPTNSINK